MGTASTFTSKGSMKPSSSQSEGLFTDLFARGAVAACVDDAAWLQAMLDFEAALAHGLAAAGLIPAEAADSIASKCDASLYDVAEIGRGAGEKGTPVRERVPALQLGGAVGTLASLGEHGLEVAAEAARRLELAEPTLPWHTVRLRPALLAGALGAAAGVIGKVARDVTLLAQTEVGEASEAGGDGRGGSSTMPHKRNPVAAVAAEACAQRVPGLVATMLAAMAQEHERAAGAWQAEWETLSELLRLTGSAAAWLREALESLQPDPGRMRANLDLTPRLLMAESVATALTDSLGRPR